MRHYVVVANQTLGGEELVQIVRDRMAQGPCDFFIVVPATPVPHLESDYVAMPVLGGMPTVLSSPEEAQRLAQEQLDSALKQFAAVGATVDGAVGDGDPILAVRETLTGGRECDEIIVSTLPARLSRWLHQDLPRRLEHKFHLPVTHVGVSKPGSRTHAR